MTKQEYLDEARTALARVFEVDDETEALEALAELAEDLADLIDDIAADGVEAGVPVVAEGRS